MMMMRPEIYSQKRKWLRTARKLHILLPRRLAIGSRGQIRPQNTTSGFGKLESVFFGYRGHTYGKITPTQ